MGRSRIQKTRRNEDTFTKTKTHGYYEVSICINKVSKRYKVHRLVLLTFVGKAPKGMECLHGDGNKLNNNLSNLRWGTRKENIADSIKHGTFQRAIEASVRVTKGSKLSEETKKKMSIAKAKTWYEKRLAKMNAPIPERIT